MEVAWVESLVAALLAWIQLSTGYDLPAASPEIEFVSHQHLVDVLCGGTECSVVGMYLRGDTIYLDDRLDVVKDVHHRSILVHELVHYVQTQSGKFAGLDCDDWLAQEREAYIVQAKWLRESRAIVPFRMKLPPEDFCLKARARELAAGVQD
jgi:hypothetical protein